MATGFQGSTDNNADVFQLIAGATAINTVALTSVTLSETPTVAQYLDLRPYRRTLGFIPDEAEIVVRSTAGSDAMSVGICQVLVADAASATGGPLGIGTTDTDKGALNDGVALGESSTDRIFHRERIAGLASVDGIQVQLGTFGGTDTAVRVELLFARRQRGA